MLGWTALDCIALPDFYTAGLLGDLHTWTAEDLIVEHRCMGNGGPLLEPGDWTHCWRSEDLHTWTHCRRPGHWTLETCWRLETWTLHRRTRSPTVEAKKIIHSTGQLDRQSLSQLDARRTLSLMHWTDEAFDCCVLNSSRTAGGWHHPCVKNRNSFHLHLVSPNSISLF